MMDKTEIEKLRTLDFTKQKAFAYLTCERLYPNYIYFSDNFHFGDPVVLREAIDYLYDNLFEHHADKNMLRRLIQNVERNTPDTENHSVIFISSALDACTSILDSLDFLRDRDVEKIANIYSYAFDTVDMYISEIENLEAMDKEYMQKVYNHPLMKKEVAIQSGIINYLQKSSPIDYADVQTLLALQENNNKGSLNL